MYTNPLHATLSTPIVPAPMSAPTLPRLIYCAGGNSVFARVAMGAGWGYGSCLPKTVYGDLDFADQDWRKPNDAAYLAALAKHRPRVATVRDLERYDQLAMVLDLAVKMAQYVDYLIIIPKVPGVIRELPRYINGKRVILGYSVPTKHGATSVPVSEFAGWPVHLLGGSPAAQVRLWRYLSCVADVVSADGNMAHLMAHRKCAFWGKKAYGRGGWRWTWVQLREVGAGDFGPGSNLEAFRRSCANIMTMWGGVV